MHYFGAIGYTDCMNSHFDANALLDSLTTAVVVVDEQCAIQYANGAAEGLFAQSQKGLADTALQYWLGQSPIDWTRLQSVLTTQNAFVQNDTCLIFADGRHCQVDLSVTHVPLQQGAHLLIEIKPIEQQKRLHQESFRQEQQQASRELIRGLAHEIKNPLGGIRGAAQLLQHELLNPEDSEYTQLIIQQTDRLRNLVDRLLGPNHLPQFANCNVHQILEQIRGLLSAEAQQPLHISRDYDPSIPELWVDGDMLQQALLNIARNAMQALVGTTKPQIRLLSRIARQQTLYGQLYPLCAQIQIQDNGPGIAPESQERLFYPLVSSKPNGHGVGLSIAQRLVELHKGSIQLHSQPGDTRFIVTLPILKQGDKHDR